MEGAELGLFMLAAALAVALVEHPASPLRAALDDAFARRALVGLAMGATAVAIVHSPFGRRSGAHFNPAVTLAFWRLGRIAPADALGYVVGQFVGGAIGLQVAATLLGRGVIGDPTVNFIVTAPGTAGTGAALLAETAMSFALMLTVLVISNRPAINRHTALACGALVALFITVEAPLSGMSMNPARSLASAWVSGEWSSLWLYFAAPPLGMLLAAEAYLRRRGPGAVLCCKLHHDNPQRCIFRCRYGEGRAA